MIQTFINGQWVNQAPSYGQKYRKLTNGVVVLESYWGDQADSRAVYTMKNESVLVNGQPLQPFAGSYYCNTGDTIQLSGEIVDNGAVVTSIDIPVTLKMPLIRHANGLPTQDEIYLNVTLNSGVMTASGTIERSGDWKILTERVNEALKRIGAEWLLRHNDVTFLA